MNLFKALLITAFFLMLFTAGPVLVGKISLAFPFWEWFGDWMLGALSLGVGTGLVILTMVFWGDAVRYVRNMSDHRERTMATPQYKPYSQGKGENDDHLTGD